VRAVCLLPWTYHAIDEAQARLRSCGSLFRVDRGILKPSVIATAPASHLVSGRPDQTRSATKGVMGVFQARQIGRWPEPAANRCMSLRVWRGMGGSRGLRPAVQRGQPRHRSSEARLSVWRAPWQAALSDRCKSPPGNRSSPATRRTVWTTVDSSLRKSGARRPACAADLARSALRHSPRARG
jgi:hypothetical protein